MKIIISILFIALGSLSIQAQSSLEGQWQTGKDNTVVEIKETQNGMEGRIALSDNPKALPGTLLIKELQMTNKGFEGKLYAIKSKRWVDALFIPDQDQVEIRVKAGFKKKTIHWKREN